MSYLSIFSGRSDDVNRGGGDEDSHTGNTDTGGSTSDSTRGDGHDTGR